MIHDRAYHPVQVSAHNQAVNPFYLFLSDDELTRMPLPRAVALGIPEALVWRDIWEKSTNQETKAYTLFHPRLRNWVGGAENSLVEVNECLAHYGLPLINNPAYRPFPHQTGL